LNDLYKSLFSRNFGFFSEIEQDRLRRSSIAIAGMGGVGGLLAERLIRLGIGRLKISDCGTFEQTNINRQFTSSTANLGTNKAESVFEHIKFINPEAQVTWDAKGILSEEDAHAFVQDCDLVIDEMDITAFKESLILQRAARRKGIYHIFATAIGFGCLVVNFNPEGMTLEEYNALSPNIDLNRGPQLKLSLEKMMPIMPSYVEHLIGDPNFQKVRTGERPPPTTSIGVGLASIVAADEGIRVLLRRDTVLDAPKYLYIDLMDRKLSIGSM
jgi:molybdopterin/thiamine biosynthesis adenylyltransferase